LNYDDFEKLCSNNDLLYSKAIMRGKYSDLSKFDIETFQTLIPNHFNLPPIPNNIAEGIVLKPVINKFTSKGNRVILKYKSEKFREVVGIKKVKDKKVIEIVPQSDIVSYHKTNIEQYVNENRLHSVLSKWGDVVTTKDEGKLTGLLSKDALSEYMQRNGICF
jgi:Rnl2 family RNA ligase